LSTLRRFLYVSPCFPPQSRVGALRPLKFARHLPDHGWAPVVLTDLSPEDAIDTSLGAQVPVSTVVHRTYSRRAAPTEAQVQAGELPWEVDSGGKPLSLPAYKKLLPPALRNEYRSRSFWWPSPELLPLGHYSPDIPHAIRAGRAALATHPDCEAIVVNADPWAALLVGRSLAQRSGLPLVLDLRDPWSVCELKRHRRPLPQRWLVDRLERMCVQAAARVIVNTETTLADYRAHYPDVPAERFDVIRNHGDPALIGEGSYPAQPAFTALFLGNFRRFVSGDILIDAVGQLHERLGWGPEQLRLMVTGRLPAAARARAARLGVTDMLVDHPFVPYREIGTFMQTADLLVSLNHRTRQRVPAKIYDYLMSDRPMLVVADNPELQRMLGAVDGVDLHGLDDLHGVAASLERAVLAGRGRQIPRRGLGFDSATASAKLARILDVVTRERAG
jgi:hypothetical protein